MIVEADLSSSNYKKKIIASLDVAKFICAILVVMLHTAPLYDINTYLDYGIKNYIARLAVPFFFVTSGYLCFRKTSYEKFDFAVPKRYALKILKLYILWTIIYSIPFLDGSVCKCSRGYIWGVLSAILIFVFSGYFHLWYLNALAVAVLLVGLAVEKKFKIRTIIIVGIILYMLGLLGQSYFFLIKPLERFPLIWEALRLFRKVIGTTRNGIFEGILYVSIGMVFAYKKIVFKYIYAVIGFVLSMLMFFVEVFVIKYYELYYAKDYYIFLLPAVFFLFYLVTHFEVKQSKITNQLRIIVC